MFKRNIIIIGGGPSGLSTALHLKKISPHLASGLLVLEKAHYPRPKPCAGGLVADAEVILKRLGLDVSEIPYIDASAVHFDFAGEGLTVSLPHTHMLRSIRRNEFDAWLANKTRESGIENREGVTVKNVRPRDDCVMVETDARTFTAQIVVGADGSRGITRRCILPDVPVHAARTLEINTPVNDVSGVAATWRYPLKNKMVSRDSLPSDMHEADHAYFDFFPVSEGIAGYTWDFPTQINGQPMRCWGIYDTNLSAYKERPGLKDLLAKEMSRHGFDLSQYKIEGHPIRWFSPLHQFSVPRVILVGDAAGADGFFGEGISMALGYGLVAAKAIKHAFAQNEFSFHNYRRRILLSPLGQTLIVRTAITHIFYRIHRTCLQKFFRCSVKRFIALFFWVFVINWAKRMK